MAKDNKKTTKKEEIAEIEEEVILVSEDTVKKIEEIKLEEEITLVPNETEPIAQKNVKILMNVNHKCYIGGEWYYLQAGKQYNVPENVKNILLNSNLLKPL